MSANDDRFDPAGDKSGDVLTDDGLPENRAAEDVTDGPVWRAPHLLQLEFLHALLIRRDGGALDAHVVTLDRLRRFDGHSVICGVAVLHPQIIAAQAKKKGESLRSFE